MEHIKILTGKKACVNKAVKNQWLTPEIIAMMDKIIKEKCFVREVIYPKEILGCEIFEYNGCMRLYNNKDRFFALDGERINSEAGKYCDLNADFFSAEKIVVQQRDDKAFDHLCNSDPFELTSLWPERQLVVVANHKNRQLIAFAPVFIVCTPDLHSTKDLEKCLDFINEFSSYMNKVEKNLDKKKYQEAISFLKNSYNLLLWLKNHCY